MINKLREEIKNLRVSHIFIFAMAELLHILKFHILSLQLHLLNKYSNTHKILFFIAIVKNDNYIVHD
jgi:hypothetical protein